MLAFRIAVPLLLCLPLVAGCAKSPEEKLKGKWVGERIENVTFEQILTATGWVRGMTVELDGKTMTVSVPNEAPRSGTYAVERADKDALVLNVPRPDGFGTDQMKLSFVDENTLRWDIGESRDIVLVRAKQ